MLSFHCPMVSSVFTPLDLNKMFKFPIFASESSPVGNVYELDVVKAFNLNVSANLHSCSKSKTLQLTHLACVFEHHFVDLFMLINFRNSKILGTNNIILLLYLFAGTVNEM